MCKHAAARAPGARTLHLGVEVLGGLGGARRAPATPATPAAATATTRRGGGSSALARRARLAGAGQGARGLGSLGRGLRRVDDHLDLERALAVNQPVVVLRVRPVRVLGTLEDDRDHARGLAVRPVAHHHPAQRADRGGEELLHLGLGHIHGQVAHDDLAARAGRRAPGDHHRWLLPVRLADCRGGRCAHSSGLGRLLGPRRARLLRAALGRPRLLAVAADDVVQGWHGQHFAVQARWRHIHLSRLEACRCAEVINRDHSS